MFAKMPNQTGKSSFNRKIFFGLCTRLQVVFFKELFFLVNKVLKTSVIHLSGNFGEDKSFHSFASEMEVRDKIIEKAAELYTQYGIRTVTMDDIARELGISKKTIYQYFKDKSDLVNTTAKLHLDAESSRFLGLTEKSENSVHELILLSCCLRDAMREMKMNLLNELQKFYPKAWKMYEEFKGKVMKDSIMNVIERGQKEGYFRPEINAEILATMRIEQVHYFIVGNFFSPRQYTLETIQMQLYDHFIHGLFTLEGHQLFNQYTTTTKAKHNEAQNY